jgi:hypothetical protein
MGANGKKCRYFMSLLQVFDIGDVVPVMVSGPSFIFGKYAFKNHFQTYCDVFRGMPKPGMVFWFSVCIVIVFIIL